METYKERVITLINSKELTQEQQLMLEEIFPELKESEDERIRKAIIAMCNKMVINGIAHEYGTVNVNIDNMIAWLEKQGEHAKFRDSIQTGDQVTRNQDGVLVNLSQLKRVAKSAEKVEPKFDDVEEVNFFDDFRKTDSEVEPKFKERDWIIIDGETLHITNVTEDGYSTEEGGYIPFRCEKDARLWTIQDAKTGDVILDGNYPFIFKKTKYNSKHCYAFCGIGQDGNFMVNPYNWYGKEDSSEVWTWGRDLKPATKEQRDLLFQKMKEAGYEWDADAKVLKEIDKVIDYLDSLPKDNWELVREFVEKFGKIPKDEDELNVLVEYVLKRQEPTEWSKEEENLLKLSLENLTELKDRYGEEYGKVGACINWLKSIRLQNTWKPSNKQMEGLFWVLENCAEREGSSKMLSLANSIYDDLKKLREE